MREIPLLQIEQFLIVSVQSEPTDAEAEALQKRLLDTLGQNQARGFLLDFSGLDIVDSFLARIIRDTAQMGKLMGVPTTVVGLNPAVAITLTELGLALPDIHTDLNLERGLEWLRKATR